MTNIAKQNFIDPQGHPYFHELFEDAKRKISKRVDRDDFFLWRLRENTFGFWEDLLHEASKILGIATPKEFAKTFEVRPNDIAGRPGRFQDFMSEIYILHALHYFNFANIKKLNTEQSMANPEFTAEFKGQPFVIEVWHRGPEDEKEDIAKDDLGVYDLLEVDAFFIGTIERNLQKFVRQLSRFRGYKSMAAIYYEWTAQGIHAQNWNMELVGQSLLTKVNNKIDYFLFMSHREDLGDRTNFNKTFIVPTLGQ